MSGQQRIGNLLICGYARVAIEMLTNTKALDKVKQRKQFLALFKSHAGYIDDITYFDDGDPVHDTKFDRGCQEILKRFSMKWHPSEAQREYMSTFSVESWKRLPSQVRRTHTLTNCQGCLLSHAVLQAKFPGTNHQLSHTEAMHDAANQS